MECPCPIQTRQPRKAPDEFPLTLFLDPPNILRNCESQNFKCQEFYIQIRYIGKKIQKF